ncbi:MAG: SDR family NAD(P)-dependent oxidoreductase [Bacteroidales bacterium]|nr:SDR family NAD(P)-dependent oxidoreductase [Bacteroidales bacterium]
MSNPSLPYALVTGASSGIGYQYARQLAKRGYNLLIVSNEAEAIVEKADCIKTDFPVDVVPLMRDLGQPDAAKELYNFCKKNGWTVEVLINNAGVYHDRDFIADSEGFNQLILNLHVNTPAMLIYYFSQDMVARHKGYILNMSSITSEIAVQRLATYSATKAFLKNFNRSVHVELYHKGVYVTAVRPGAVDTGLYNISSTATKIGKAVGYITTPERLARQGLRAMFRGKAQRTPGFLNHVLIFLVALLPTGALRLIRRWNWF